MQRPRLPPLANFTRAGYGHRHLNRSAHPDADKPALGQLTAVEYETIMVDTAVQAALTELSLTARNEDGQRTYVASCHLEPAHG
jgi:hypothetical protein